MLRGPTETQLKGVDMSVTTETAPASEEQIICPECDANAWQEVWSGYSTNVVVLTNSDGDLAAESEYEASYDGDSLEYHCQACGFELNSEADASELKTETVELPTPETPQAAAERAVRDATWQLERAQAALDALAAA
jgi:RNA polymerase subunit RPABC4/transcription elongation factor Spt4